MVISSDRCEPILSLCPLPLHSILAKCFSTTSPDSGTINLSAKSYNRIMDKRSIETIVVCKATSPDLPRIPTTVALALG